MIHSLLPRRSRSIGNNRSLCHCSSVVSELLQRIKGHDGLALIPVLGMRALALCVCTLWMLASLPAASALQVPVQSPDQKRDAAIAAQPAICVVIRTYHGHGGDGVSQRRQGLRQLLASLRQQTNPKCGISLNGTLSPTAHTPDNIASFERNTLLNCMDGVSR